MFFVLRRGRATPNHVIVWVRQQFYFDFHVGDFSNTCACTMSMYSHTCLPPPQKERSTCKLLSCFVFKQKIVHPEEMQPATTMTWHDFPWFLLAKDCTWRLASAWRSLHARLTTIFGGTRHQQDMVGGRGTHLVRMRPMKDVTRHIDGIDGQNLGEARVMYICTYIIGICSIYIPWIGRCLNHSHWLAGWFVQKRMAHL